MKNRTGYFQFHLINEDGSEKHVWQNGKLNDFELSVKPNNGSWQRVYRRNGIGTSWYGSLLDSNWYGSTHGMQTMSRGSVESIMTVTNVNHDASSITVDASNIRRSAQVQGLTSGVPIRELQSREELSQRFPSHMDHVRSHQEAINQMAAAQAQAMVNRNEMERRAEQRRAEQERIEQARTRERRPWERVRNFFGQD